MPRSSKRRTPLTTVTANFPGAAFPPETKVAFTDKNGTTFNGTVIELSPRRAEVATQDGTHWKVPYPLLTVTQPAEKPAMTLQEIETLAKQLIRKHEKESDLEPGWQFRFDFASSRGGVCKYTEKLITLSVTYCLKAWKAEIEDTILHEIAHAIVGPGHGHDTVWEETAYRIDCTAVRCHTVDHTLPRWHGHCGCQEPHERQRLTQRNTDAECLACGREIDWKRATG